MKTNTPINTNSQPNKKESASLANTPTYKPSQPSQEEKYDIDKIEPI